MGDQHMNPDDAVRAFQDCGAELALGHHFETFQLTDEPFDAPRRKALIEAALPQASQRSVSGCWM